MGPNAVADQSYSRIRCPISPPPVKNSGIAVFASIEVLKLKHPPQKEAALLERLFFFYGMMGLVLRFSLILRIVHEDHIHATVLGHALGRIIAGDRPGAAITNGLHPFGRNAMLFQIADNGMGAAV